MTTGGEGGMLVMDDTSLWKRAWAFKDHGKSWDAVYERDHAPGFRWLHESFGTNWRMTEMQAAIGRVQLGKLDDWVKTRRKHAAKLTACCKNLPGLRVTMPGDEIFHSYYKYYVFVRPERLQDGWNRDRIMNEIMNRGVPCYSGSCSEIYREKAFTHAGYGPKKRLPVAKKLGETSLMFLVHPTLTTQEIDKTCQTIDNVMRLATR
jgi:dTDP-4-amino-4,6-dideoxygalactose transaminase